MAPESTDPSRTSDGHFMYFGFGSNLFTERLRLMNPSAEFVGTGRLDDFALGFTGFSRRWQGAGATVYKCIGEHVHVWGCVWKIAIENSDSLDEQERAYRRLYVAIKLSNGDTVMCRTYQHRDVMHGDHHPSPHYKHVIISGAIEHKLPQSYIDMLRDVQDNGFKGRIGYDFSVLAKLNAQGTD